jgi:hypothetical protein
LAAAERPAAPFVLAARLAAAPRSDAGFLAAAPCACFDSAFVEAAERPSCFNGFARRARSGPRDFLLAALAGTSRTRCATARRFRNGSIRWRRQIDTGSPSLRQPDRNGLLGRACSMLALAYVLDLLVHEFAGLGGRGFAFRLSFFARCNVALSGILTSVCSFTAHCLPESQCGLAGYVSADADARCRTTESPP